MHFLELILLPFKFPNVFFSFPLVVHPRRNLHGLATDELVAVRVSGSAKQKIIAVRELHMVHVHGCF